MSAEYLSPENEASAIAQYSCPRCNAKTGERCWNLVTKDREVHTKHVHVARRRLWWAGEGLGQIEGSLPQTCGAKAKEEAS